MTEPEAAEESLSRREPSILSAILESAMDAILVCDDRQRIVLFNHAAEVLFGLTADEAIGSPLSRLLPPAAREAHTRQVRAFGDTGATRRRMGALHVVDGLHADGTVMPLETSISTAVREGRRYFTAILRDMRAELAAREERATAAERLRDSETRLRALIDNSEAVVWIKDLEGRYQVVSPYALRSLGMRPEEMLGRTSEEVFASPAAAALAANDRRVLETGESIVVEEAVPAFGTERTFRAVKFPLRDAAGEIFGLGAICTDVTDLRDAARALDAERTRLRALLNTLPACVWLKDPDGRYLACNPAYEELAGRPESELLGRSIYDLLERDQAERARAEDQRAVEAGVPIVYEQWLTLPREGRRALFEFVKTPMHGSDGRLIGVLAVARDVTEERRLAEALREGEAVMRRVVSGSPAVIYALRVEPRALRLVWVSGNLEAMTGWTEDEARDTSWWLANVHPDDREEARRASALPYQHDHQVLEFRFLRKSGGYFWVRDEKRLLRDESGQPSEIVGSWIDVTSRRQLEEQLRVAHKLEAIGRLAGGIAHDFNNLLTVISGNTEMLASGELPPAERILLSEIRDAGERAALLTRQLLTFSRSQVLAAHDIDLNDAVRRVQAMLRRLIGEDVDLVCELGADAGFVHVDPGQLEQVIVNLAVNARDAMPVGGRLTLATSAAELNGEDESLRGTIAPGCYARLTVSDTGTGMTPEVRARIFEPFFTTKAQGKGTGLGLATVFGIVEQSAGHIRVESELGVGTTFEILLPAVITPQQQEDVAEGEKKRAGSGKETILLVEDEAGVRRVARAALERAGYRVLWAEEGTAAAALADSYDGSIDLLLTDVVLPGIGGLELADLLRARRADLKVLFMTGYAEADGSQVAESEMLLKPFALADLTARVRGILDADREPRRGAV